MARVDIRGEAILGESYATDGVECLVTSQRNEEVF